MLDTEINERSKACAFSRARKDKSLAVMCTKIVQLAVQASPEQLLLPLHAPFNSASDELNALLKRVGISSDELMLLARSGSFKDFRATCFVLGPVSHACNIFLDAHLDRWVNGYQSV